MFCPNCGKENVKDAKFCSFCGNSLTVKTQSTETQPQWRVGMPCPFCGGNKLEGNHCAYCGGLLMLPEEAHIEEPSCGSVIPGIYPGVYKGTFLRLEKDRLTVRNLKQDEITIPYEQLRGIFFGVELSEGSDISPRESWITFRWDEVMALGMPARVTDAIWDAATFLFYRDKVPCYAEIYRQLLRISDQNRSAKIDVDKRHLYEKWEGIYQKHIYKCMNSYLRLEPQGMYIKARLRSREIYLSYEEITDIRFGYENPLGWVYFQRWGDQQTDIPQSVVDAYTNPSSIIFDNRRSVAYAQLSYIMKALLVSHHQSENLFE